MCGGTAVAEVLFGTVNPSGRLPISFPRSAGHGRSVYNHRPGAYHRSRFRFGSSEPLVSFGHGLSYTTFDYRELRAPARAVVGDAVAVEVRVENTGRCAGDDIVLLFLQDEFASVSRPVRQLAAFARVSLEPGQSQWVRFLLEPSAFTLLDRHLCRVTEPGGFRLMVGSLERRLVLTSPAH